MAPASRQPTGNAPDIQQALDLALQHHTAGRLPEAETIYQQILQADPSQPVALRLLGVIAHQVGKNDIAVDLITKALVLKPDYAEAHSNLGIALQALGQLDEAVTSYHKALVLKPDYDEAHNNLGNVFQELGRLDEAVASYHKALVLKPDFAEAHNNLGGALQDLGQLDQAVASFHKALAIKPDYAEAHNNLGNALKALGKLDEAVASHRKALVLKPDYATAHNNLGNTLRDMGDLDEAVANYRKALAIKPDFAKAHSNLLLTLNYSPGATEADILEESRDWNRRHASVLAETWDHPNDRSPDRRLRVGYVSPDMRAHSAGYFLEPLLAAHDPAAVETFCYAGVASPDATTRRLETLADHWRWTVGMSDAALTETIHADGIDILVDLAGHTADNRLLVFARRPAPVQVTWLGYPNTTGLEAMDYRIVDAVTDPDDTASETLVRLPNGFLCYRPPDGAPPVAPARPAGPPTFGSFNNITKVTAPCIDLWSRILAELPDARLLLKSRQFADAPTREAYRNHFAARGVAPERLELRGRLESLESHLGLYADVDVCLDPFPYNGTTTTCEALWMGVPVVTLRGRHHRGRVGASLLTGMGLDDCVAADAEAYVAIAAGLARDSSRRAEFRTGSRNRMASLCDAGSFARDIEAAYRFMWRDWCAARPRQPAAKTGSQGPSSIETLSKVPPAVFEFNDGIRIKVPNSINMITPYVIHEQGQWFEKEIHFVHEFLKPGMQALDIGANYGVYTLPMAKILGSEGALWAFEPTSTTAAYLNDSLAENGFDNVELIQAALSNRTGNTKLNLNPNSELNKITDSPVSDFEEITLKTLDQCMEEFGWKQIDFVKLDAEGEEENILQGGRGFLRELSPLVMFEIRHGNKVNVSLIESFASLNYNTYRYIHSLRLLVPFKTDEIPDHYELNLFSCKEDTANRLEKSGVLVTASALNETQEPAPQDNWQSLFTAMPYYTRLYGDRISVDAFAAGTDRDAYIEALKLFFSAQSNEHAPAKRYLALCGAVALLSPIANATNAPMTRLCSLARILGAAGLRGTEVLVLQRLLAALKAQPSIRLDEPFLAACPRFDHVDPGADQMLKWFAAQVIEQLETQIVFSSFYSHESGRKNLEMLSATGFMSEAMERRLNLIKGGWPG